MNLLNELGKRNKMRDMPSILSLFDNKFKKFNNTGERMLDSIYHIKTLKKLHFLCEKVKIFSYFTQRYNGHHYVSSKSLNH